MKEYCLYCGHWDCLKEKCGFQSNAPYAEQDPCAAAEMEFIYATEIINGGMLI